MKVLKIILIFIANLLIDLAILSKYQIFGIIPSISIPLIVVLSIYKNNPNIMYYAMIQGFFQDIAFSKILGSTALVYYLISYYTYNYDLRKNYNLFYGVKAVVLGIIVSKPLKYFVGLITGKNVLKDIINIFKLNIFFEIILSIGIYVLIYLIFYYFRKKDLRNYY